MPTLFKTIVAVIGGGILAFASPLLAILGNLPEVVSGEFVLDNVLAGTVPTFISAFTVIYVTWTLFQLIWALISSKRDKVEPARIPDEKIEKRVEEIKETLPDEQLKEPAPDEDVDKYFKKKEG